MTLSLNTIYSALAVIFVKLLIYAHCGEGNGKPLQYSCLENPMDGGAWWAAVHGGRTELDTTEVT